MKKFDISLKKFALWTTASACLLQLPAAIARPPHPPGPPGGGAWPILQEVLDQDQDGKISQQEFNEVADRFSALDLDADGFLTPEDFHQMEQKRRLGHRLTRLADTDEDRSVTQTEWESLLSTLDENADRTISSTELESRFQEHRATRKEEFRKRRPAPEEDEQGGPEDGLAPKSRGQFGPDSRDRFEGPREGRRRRPGFRGQDGPRHQYGRKGGRRAPGGPMSHINQDWTTDELSALFLEMDRNGDGILNKDDRPAPPPHGRRPEAPPEEDF